MAFYESVFIVRQDVSSNDVDKLVVEIGNIIKENGGEVIKNEYWGLRTLAYEIKGNKKGHYIFLGLEAKPQTIKEMERRMKLNENIVRVFTTNVENISSEPSPILRSEEDLAAQETVDMTLNK